VIIAAGFLVLLAVAELTAWALVRWHRPAFPWLVTRADIAPPLTTELVQAHARKSFDSELGWCRRPGEVGVERVTHGSARYSVDDAGRRTNPAYGEAPAAVACFGDSFVFCRLVNDDQTWPHHLSVLMGANVANYGVGNYGLDQALLRLERELPTLEAGVVLMGVVPETIARVQSVWKHYFEYGNTLAFKPRFVCTAAGLQLRRSPIIEPSDYSSYTRALVDIQQADPFYQRKFRRDLLIFPYLFRLARRAQRQLPILMHLTWGRLRRNPGEGFRRAFGTVVRENARLTRTLYQEPESVELLTALVERFTNACCAAGKKCALIVLPQPHDLEPDSPHTSFFAGLGRMLPVVDLTADFRADPEPLTLYAYGKLGPHPSDRGNRLIAETIAAKLPMLAPAGAEAVQEAS
jgi:hypothetical protein